MYLLIDCRFSIQALPSRSGEDVVQASTRLSELPRLVNAAQAL